MGINVLNDTTLKSDNQNSKEKISNILNLSVPILMGIFLFFNPFSHTTAIKEFCFYLSVFIVLILICFKKIDFSFRSPLSLPFALFTAWAFIGLFFALYKENSFHDFYAHLLKYLAIYYIMINFFNSRKRFIILSWVIIVSATIFSIGGMGYFYLVLGNKTRMTFQETSINIIGFVSIFSLLLSAHLLPRTDLLYKKILLIVSFTATSIVTVMTLSSGTLLGMILSILVLFAKNKKIVFFTSLFLLTVLVIAIFSLTTYQTRMSSNFIQYKLKSSKERIKIWRTYLEIIKDYPISGIGFDMHDMWHDSKLWDKYLARIPSKLRTHTKRRVPHNMLISITVRLGLVGLGLFFYILFMFVRMSWIVVKHGKDDFIKSWGLCITAVFVAWIIKGMFEPALSHVPAIINYTIFAMMTVLWKLNSESDFQTE